LTSLEEYRRCEHLQDLIWGPTDVIRVSALVLITAQNNGGMVIGAFSADEELVGFVCAYPGLTADGRLKQCSQLMAVHPNRRNERIGYELKLAQRQETLDRNIELCTWTFDPLASTNAYLNVNKLGAVAGQYIPDCYGPGGEGESAGLATDRLLAEWWVGSRWVEGHLAGRRPHRALSSPPVNTVVGRAGDGMPVNRRIDLERRGAAIRVEIPADLEVLKRTDPGLARAWRQESREIFTTYLERGYRVVGFESLEAASSRRCYVLSDGTASSECSEPGAGV